MTREIQFLGSYSSAFLKEAVFSFWRREKSTVNLTASLEIVRIQVLSIQVGYWSLRDFWKTLFLPIIAYSSLHYLKICDVLLEKSF